jgi:hypothetical protein
MSCSICFDDITTATGHTQMSCSHTFHFLCLTKWFGSQVMKDLPETCPCCRHEANEHEALPEEFESEEESEEEYESEEDSAPEVIAAAEKFAAKRASLSEDEFATYAALRIQAAVRAYGPRANWVRYKMLLKEQKDLETQLNVVKLAKEMSERDRKFRAKALTMPRAAWQKLCATMIQSLWRGVASRRSTLRGGLRVFWECDDGVWSRTVLSCSETWDRGLEPQSLAFQRHQTAKQFQAMWRGYRIRKAMAAHDGKGAVLFTHAIMNAVIQHLGGTEITGDAFRQLPPLNRGSFRDLCILNDARDPTEIDWRHAASACRWIPKSLAEEAASSDERTTFVPKIKYSGIATGWTLSLQYHRRNNVVPAAAKVQAVWRGYRTRKAMRVHSTERTFWQCIYVSHMPK